MKMKEDKLIVLSMCSIGDALELAEMLMRTDPTYSPETAIVVAIVEITHPFSEEEKEKINKRVKETLGTNTHIHAQWEVRPGLAQLGKFAVSTIPLTVKRGCYRTPEQVSQACIREAIRTERVSN